MFNPIISGLIALIAFVFSFILGLVSRTTMPILLIRPLIFAVLFFIISALVNVLVNRFLPELLEHNIPDADTDILPGSRVNILEGDDEEGSKELSPEPYAAAAPVQISIGARPDDSDDNLGDISGLSSLIVQPSPGQNTGGEITGGMDQNAEEGYTGREASAGMAMDSEEVLPDLDSMAGAFTLNASAEEPDTTEYTVPAPSRKSTTSRPAKGSEWAGDFNAKEIAMGLRTALNKDKEG